MKERRAIFNPTPPYAPAQRAMAYAWSVVETMAGYVPTRLLADQPQHIQQAWVGAVQSQTCEAKAIGVVVEAESP